VFQGVHYSNLDDKGRLAIPARHRELLQQYESETLVVTVHHQTHCLVARPLSVWERLAQQIQRLPNVSPQVQLFQRKLLGYAQELNPDGNGRVLLNPSLREYARLEKRVAVAGLGERLEIWNNTAWDREMGRPMDSIPEVLGELSL